MRERGREGERERGRGREREGERERERERERGGEKVGKIKGEGRERNRVSGSDSHINGNDLHSETHIE